MQPVAGIWKDKTCDEDSDFSDEPDDLPPRPQFRLRGTKLFMATEKPASTVQGFGEVGHTHLSEEEQKWAPREYLVEVKVRLTQRCARRSCWSKCSNVRIMLPKKKKKILLGASEGVRMYCANRMST